MSSVASMVFLNSLRCLAFFGNHGAKASPNRSGGSPFCPADADPRPVLWFPPKISAFICSQKFFWLSMFLFFWLFSFIFFQICVHLRSSAAKKFFRLSKFLFFWLFLGLSHTEFFSRLTSFNNEEKVRIPLTNARAQVSVLV